MRLPAFVALGLCAIESLARPAFAAEERRVVVLLPSELPAASWPEGTQAVIAEFAAIHYQVVVESSPAHDLRSLLDELKLAASQRDNSGAVAVVREGAAGIAYVWTSRDTHVVRVQTETTEGAVNEGTLALRVTELVRARAIEIPPIPSSAGATPAPASPRERPPERPRRALVWLGAGPTFASGARAPLLAGGLGVRIPLWQSPLSLELAAAITLAPLKVDTSAGSVNLSSHSALLFAMFDPWSRATASAAFGVGGGAIWFSESAAPKPGYAGNTDNTYVGVLSLRATGAVRSGNVSFGLSAEPGILLPGASIRASGREVASVGPLWASLGASVGWMLP